MKMMLLSLARPGQRHRAASSKPLSKARHHEDTDSSSNIASCQDVHGLGRVDDVDERGERRRLAGTGRTR